MNQGKTVFSQVMDYVPRRIFDGCIKRYGGDKYKKGMSCKDQFLSMAFAQMTHRESLRDIEICLQSQASKLYHMGFRWKISRTSLARANEKNDWRIYADLAQFFIDQARRLYVNENFGVDLKSTVYALDSSTIDLCLSCFKWAKFRTTKAGIKLHTLLDIRGSIPVFINVSEASLHDVNILDELVIEAGSIYVMDRGYLDFERLYFLNEQKGFFIIRAKKNMVYTRIYSTPVDKTTGLICDQTIQIRNRKYPDKVRRIKFYDEVSQKTYCFLTNNFVIEAYEITKLYKARWQVELFFKWIKQHLKIKSFFGRSQNAVKSQIWIAISTYVLLAIIKKRLNIDHSLYTFLQAVSVNPFSKIQLYQMLNSCYSASETNPGRKQLFLFN